MSRPGVRPTVCFVGQVGPYSPAALRAFLARQDDFICGLVIEGHRRPLGQRLHHYRPPQAPSPQAPCDRDSLLATAQAHGVPVLQTADINDRYVQRALQHAHCDILVCAGYFELLRPGLLYQVTLALNAHPSLLPKWRGAAPLFWALKAGAEQSGVSVHVMDAKFDCGPVLLQRPFALVPRQSGAALFRAAGTLAGSMLAEVVARHAALGAAALCAVPQDETHASRAPFPGPHDARIEPSQWRLEPLLNFACGAPFFRTPYVRLGDDRVFVRRGIDGIVGGKLPGSHLLWGDALHLPCQDGVARLQVQT